VHKTNTLVDSGFIEFINLVLDLRILYFIRISYSHQSQILSFGNFANIVTYYGVKPQFANFSTGCFNSSMTSGTRIHLSLRHPKVEQTQVDSGMLATLS